MEVGLAVLLDVVTLIEGRNGVFSQGPLDFSRCDVIPRESQVEGKVLLSLTHRRAALGMMRGLLHSSSDRRYYDGLLSSSESLTMVVARKDVLTGVQESYEALGIAELSSNCVAHKYLQVKLT